MDATLVRLPLPGPKKANQQLKLIKVFIDLELDQSKSYRIRLLTQAKAEAASECCNHPVSDRSRIRSFSNCLMERSRRTPDYLILDGADESSTPPRALSSCYSPSFSDRTGKTDDQIPAGLCFKASYQGKIAVLDSTPQNPNISN
ncbi:hypothetical protein HPP92_023615 [Vanilla planifolia]|uniref:Uncharacterized protein n=1 Tax=Vanilla planifolia TaxID=51239 RepID=A0A835PL16_VANPL|nr:hypothetical protein HPP92_023925 [Vanilla planifolia]KAG0455827.1 hypothetical protein HPP92_023615 [Vanilla planifolia]